MRSVLVDRTELHRLARSQGALRHVATLVARGITPGEVFKTIVAELGSLLAADSTAISRYENDQTATVMAWWNDPDTPALTPPFTARWPIGVDSSAAVVLRTGSAVRKSKSTFSGEIGAWARSQGICHIVSGPVWVEGRLWGEVAVMFRCEVPPPPDTEARLGDFVELVGCTIAQAKSRADLIDSRARVIAASDATRRRIERDLHDGVQQHLISLKFELNAAEADLPPGQDGVRERLSSTGEGLTNVIAELQEICRGLHPAVLTRAGLKAALETLARRTPVPVELHVNVPDSLPEQVQVTLYYIVSEALNNVTKHADASTVRIEVEHDNSDVRLLVEDDGKGGAVFGPGSGLIGLKDRVEAVEGVVRLQSPVGEGTTLDVTIPT
jgi:signal transduction histidine kinase